MPANRFNSLSQQVIVHLKLILRLPVGESAGAPQSIVVPVQIRVPLPGEYALPNQRARLIRTAVSPYLPKCWLN